MAASFRTTGEARFAKNLKKLSDWAHKGEIGEAAREEMEIEAREVRRRTPVDKGDLVETVRVEGPEVKNKIIQTAITAGDEIVDYALIVHEDLEAFHRVGQAKYISSVLDESGPSLPGRIAKRVDFSKVVD